MKIDKERVARYFTELCQISSPSRRERQVAEYIKEQFAALGADEIVEDNSASQTGSECGNIIVRFHGNKLGSPTLFACHMDTVVPAENIVVVRTGDLFTSDGSTILGGDDKSGIAALLEVFAGIMESGAEHAPVELLFTTCEEIGLLGAKHLDYSLLSARKGYALDASGVGNVITQAPTANSIEITIHGLAAHAGLAPEAGINALSIAAKALSGLSIGRIDHETTCNFGLISGGSAVNIVPDMLKLEGEVRSLSPEKREKYSMEICQRFKSVVAEWQQPGVSAEPTIEIVVEKEYDAINIAESSPMITGLQKLASEGGIELSIMATGGGSDANVFNGHGIETAILGTGMDLVHTCDERIELEDMCRLGQLLQIIITAN